MTLLRPARPHRLPLRPSARAFSTTPTLPASLQIDRNDPETVADTVPAYPHGPSRWYKQSNKGLYGGQRIQFGNNVSGSFNTKTRRTFQVNVLSKRLWSHALDRFVQVRVTARTLRTIDRAGGLDEYLLGDGAARIKQLGVSGWWLRWAIMQQPSVRQRFALERYALGLAGKEEHESRLKQSEAGDVEADLEEAYAALPVEGETAAPPEASSTAKTVSKLGTIHMDGPGANRVSPSQDALLSVSNPPDLPPLKFRTDRRTHVVLTPRGWERTRPYAPEYTKQWIRDNSFPNYVDSKMQAFKQELSNLQLESMPDMSVAEEKEVLKDARRRFTRDLEEMVDQRFQEGEMRTLEKRANRLHNRRGRVDKVKGTEDAKLSNRTPDAFYFAAGTA